MLRTRRSTSFFKNPKILWCWAGVTQAVRPRDTTQEPMQQRLRRYHHYERGLGRWRNQASFTSAARRPKSGISPECWNTRRAARMAAWNSGHSIPQFRGHHLNSWVEFQLHHHPSNSVCPRRAGVPRQCKKLCPASCHPATLRARGSCQQARWCGQSAAGGPFLESPSRRVRRTRRHER